MEIDVCKVEEQLAQFSLWANKKEMIELFLDEENNLKDFCQFIYGNCCITIFPKEQILGDKCKINVFVCWSTLGCNTEKASDKMQLVHFINNLPSTELAGEIISMSALYKWLDYKNNCIDIAKCWNAGHRLPDNPLASYTMEGNAADNLYHDISWLSADLYENLWKLINLKYSKIKQSFINNQWEYPFSSPRKLFEGIIEDSINSEFLAYLKPYHEMKTRDTRLIATLGRKNIKGDIGDSDKKKLNELVRRYSRHNIWFNRLLAVSQVLGERDIFIQTRLAIHKEILNGIASMLQQATCNPNLKKLGLQKGEIWVKGHLNNL